MISCAEQNDGIKFDQAYNWTKQNLTRNTRHHATIEPVNVHLGTIVEDELWKHLYNKTG